VFSLRAETTLLSDATVETCPVCRGMEVSLYREGRDHELSQMALGPSRRDLSPGLSGRSDVAPREDRDREASHRDGQ
jgi:hypothetical protein